MRTGINRSSSVSLLHLLVALLSLVATSQVPEKAQRRDKETQELHSENKGDVREFQRRLHKADLNFAKNILKLFESLGTIRYGSEDPETIQEKRIQLETIERGGHRPGVGWSWNGHFVPVAPSSTPYFERRNRIIRNGAWNPSRKGWEYQGEFFGVWD